MADFRPIAVRPMTGAFDTLNPADEVGFGNWRIVKNATTRTTRSRQRGGGWRRLFADEFPYNNFDLHDQLVDRLGYFDQYSANLSGGGEVIGYSHAYYMGAYYVAGTPVFPPADGPFYPVYLGDTDGFYGNCPIFYPFVGYPYNTYIGVVSDGGLIAHWKFDNESGGGIPDEVSTHDLSILGGNLVPGKIGAAFKIAPTEFLTQGDADFLMGDILFGFVGWLRPHSSVGADEHIIGRWGSAGNRQYRLIITGGQLRFDVSNNGTAVVSVTHPHVLIDEEFVFFAVWHNPTANTINIKVNLESAASTAHATGVFAGGAALYFSVGYDEATSSGTMDATIDSLSAFKNDFPTDDELISLYNVGSGMDYPFVASGPTTGPPSYYLESYVYASCQVVYGGGDYSGYPYGPQTPLYNPFFAYEYDYCGTYMHYLNGCREAVTMLQQIVLASGRLLIAATMSRVYELNQSSGSWRILADGLGNSGYTLDQCTCNSVRGMSATMGGYMIFTNGFDPPMIYFAGDEATGCDLHALQPISDLVALGITQAGGVVVWKGFVIIFDIIENGERMGGTVVWSDLESPDSFIESDTSFAGRATIAVGATILNAAPLGNSLIFYTDKGIIKCTLVGGEDIFNFETLYEGGNAMKYKFSLINAGDQHLFAGESDVYMLSQFDSRPINVPFITKAAGMMFAGITEDHAAYDPVNRDACNLVTGGWSDETKEGFLSWPSGDAICPNVTLRFNLKYGTADFIDHGFTAFLTFRRDIRPTIGQWLEDLGVCERGEVVDMGVKDGDICPGSVDAVENPPLYIFNETENPELPNHPRSLCALLEGKTMEDFCSECPTDTTFIAASAEDFALKQLEDDIYYREQLGGGPYDYESYSCQGEFYHHVGYQTVMQEGAEMYRVDQEKMIKAIIVEAEPLPQSTPSIITSEVGYASTPNCFRWRETKDLEFECQTERSESQHDTAKSRQDGTFYFPCWRRGRYISARFIIDGIGGGGTFTSLTSLVKTWGDPENP